MWGSIRHQRCGAGAGIGDRGPRDARKPCGLRAIGCTWIAGEPPPPGTRARVRIRYRHGGVDGEVIADGDRALIRFDAPQIAVAPGQAAVIYDGDRVLGGGWIERALPAADAADDAVAEAAHA